MTMMEFFFLLHVALRAGMTEFFNTRNYWKEEMELHVEGKDNKAAFSCF